MKRTQKPVRKCHRCGLNLRDHCGKFESPHDMWRQGKCPGFQNEQMLREYLAEQEKLQNNLSKARRRAIMRERKTEPHHQGVAPMCRVTAH